MSSLAAWNDLQRLANSYRLQMAYYDMDHRRQQASVESLLTMLKLVGAPITSINDVPAALREREQELWRQITDPVVVVWNEEQPKIPLRLPVSLSEETLSGRLEIETAEVRNINWRLADLNPLETFELEGMKYVVKFIALPTALPYGYHWLTLELHEKLIRTLIISAPAQAYNYSNTENGKFWGVFIPLYSLYSKRSWGGGDLADLKSLIEWIAEYGGNVVATLPLLPVFLKQPTDSSPYAPITRLAWNEFYIDINHAQEIDKCENVVDLISLPSFQKDLANLRKSTNIDYQKQMTLKRKVLEELSRHCFSTNSQNAERVRNFITSYPEISEYARFRATHEQIQKPWPYWSQKHRDGVLTENDYDRKTYNYYIYTQWLLNIQINALSKEAGKFGPGLYLDFPLGIHPDGYDAWRYQHLFIHQASSGAPPDPVFTCGQNWGSPPLHPQMLRQNGYDYYKSCIRHHLRCAGVFRIDHVMGLHRLFVIPNGMDASDGVYLRYYPEEFYAILALESHRHNTLIVGEDLGIVPTYIRPAMNRHGLHHTYVVQYELCLNNHRRFPPVSHNSVVSINTHDMPPIAAFWQGLDIKDRLELNLLDSKSVKTEKKSREVIRNNLINDLRKKNMFISHKRQRGVHLSDVLKAILRLLGMSQANIVLINLEDLWLETEPQNIPGVHDDRPNWRRKARYSFETFSKLPEVTDVLREMDAIRGKGAGDEARRK